MDTCIVLTTCGSEETAQAIAEALVDQGLAVCVTLLPGANSYCAIRGTTRWDEEYQLLIYGQVDQFEAISKVIRRLHTYELPGIFLIKLDTGDPAALAWIQARMPGK
jgi:periplasmic divalent cation tolerance protein